MREAVLAIDAGTTGVTTLLVDGGGAILARGYAAVEQFYPRPGWVEQDAEQIWSAVQQSVQAALAAAPDARPVAAGIANQRETCLFWDRRRGTPLHRAIVWQCRRSASLCEELRQAGLERDITARTGLRLDPYFSGTKALWLTRNEPSLAARVREGDVAFGTIDSWLAWKLSGGRLLTTDYTNACRTLAFDIERLGWDDGLLELFGLRRQVMPEAGPSATAWGVTAGADVLPDGLPIAALAGDQQAALYGQACFHPGLTKATYGTGCFILTNTGRELVHSRRGLLATLCAGAAKRPHYALEGSIFVAGAAIDWCRDSLGLFGQASEAERLARSVPDSAGVVFVPAFAGLGSPHWHADARGAVYGLTRGARPAHIVRAALEALAFQAQDVLQVMAGDWGNPISELRVDGGAAASDFLMQLQADLSGLPVRRPASVESTALGAAYLAGLAVGFWKDEAEIESIAAAERLFEPSPDAGAKEAYRRWQLAVQGLLATRLPPADEQA